MASSSRGRRRSLVPALDRMDQILRLLADNPAGMSLNEICRLVHIPKSTAYRIVGFLNDSGYLQTTQDGHAYTLGPMLIHLAKGVLSQVDLTAVANPYLSDLSRQLGETVKLSVVKGNLVEVVACVESSSKFRIAVTVGEDFPIHAGAASKALLAFLPEAYREAVIGSNLQRFTPNTITDPAKLRSTLSEVRESGIAYDEEEFVEGIRAVASPVFNFLGEPVAAVSVAFLAAGDHEETVRAGREAAVREVARAISLRLGGVPAH